MPNDATLSWDTVAERKAWSRQLLGSIETMKTELDRGQPNLFAPRYSTLDVSGQVKFWAEFFIAIARFESSWKPHEIFHEPPPLGVDSVGLLQLSYEDEPVYHLEHLDRAGKSLEDPLVNLRCGVKIMATLVAKDGVVAATVDGKHRGGARYWSVLRAGGRHHLEEIRRHAMTSVGL
jgi:transglycosylase-like protein with SLT domain